MATIHLSSAAPAASWRRIVGHVAFAPALAAAVAAVSLMVVLPLDRAGRLEMLREWGPIENATGVVLIAAIVLALATVRLSGTFALLTAYAIGLIAAREFDLHKAFTSDGVFKTRYFVNPDIPVAEKAVVVAVLAVLIALLVTYIRGNWRRLWFGLRTLEPSAVATALGLALYVVAKTFDSLGRLLEPFGIDLPRGELGLMAMEECFELAGAACLLAAVAQHALAARARAADPRLKA
jgi:hypothetical protein